MKKILEIDVTEPGLWLDANITYGQSSGWFGHITNDLKMSIIRHFEGQAENMPCIVWICGGGWMQMDYNAHLPNLVYLAKRGYVVASVEYRCDVHFPEHLEQVKLAVRYLRAHADKYQIDPDRIGVMGESAGGHLAGLAGTTGELKKIDKGAYLEQSSAVQAACCWYMISNLNTLASRGPGDVDIIKHMLGFDPLSNPEKASWASPVAHITEKTPPFLLLHGTADQVVPISQSEEMYDALKANSVSAELYGLEGINHAQVEFFQPEAQKIIADFFDRHLKK